MVSESRPTIAGWRDALLEAAGEHRDDFIADAVARLRAGERTFGDRWTTLGLERLLAEVSEEAADIGGWGALAGEQLARENLDERDRDRVAALLATAIEAAVCAHAAIGDAQRIVTAPGGATSRQ